MTRWLLCTLAALAAFPVWSRDPLISGPQMGQRPGPYSFLIASGPQRGQQTCYVCDTAERPGVIVFARGVSEPLANLMNACDAFVATKPANEIRSWLTILGEKTISIDQLGKWAKESGLKQVPVGIFDDPVGPPAYKLNDDAEVTVLLFVNKKVQANYSFRRGELDQIAIESIKKDFSKLEPKVK